MSYVLVPRYHRRVRAILRGVGDDGGLMTTTGVTGSSEGTLDPNYFTPSPISATISRLAAAWPAGLVTVNTGIAAQIAAKAYDAWNATWDRFKLITDAAAPWVRDPDAPYYGVVNQTRGDMMNWKLGLDQFADVIKAAGTNQTVDLPPQAITAIFGAPVYEFRDVVLNLFHSLDQTFTVESQILNGEYGTSIAANLAANAAGAAIAKYGSIAIDAAPNAAVALAYGLAHIVGQVVDVAVGAAQAVLSAARGAITIIGLLPYIALGLGALWVYKTYKGRTA